MTDINIATYAFRLMAAFTMLLLVISIPSAGQDIQLSDTSKITRINKMLSEASTSLQNQKPDQAILLANEALVASKKASYLKGEAESNEILATTFAQKEDYNEALKFYFAALKNFEILKDEARVVSILIAIGSTYQTMETYAQAAKYFELAYKKLKDAKGDKKRTDALLENMAFSYERLENYQKAMQYKTLLASDYQQQGDKEKIIETYRDLASLSELSNQYRPAQKYNLELAEIYLKNNDQAGLSTVYNNIGFVYKRTGDIKTASDYFDKVTNLINKDPKGLNENDKAILHINIGVAYTNLKSYTRAKENYVTALRIYEKQKNEIGVAKVNNYLAGNYYVSGNTSRALKAVNEAIETGEKYQAEDVLATSYKILHLLYLNEKNTLKAKTYREKYKAIENKLANEQHEMKQQMLKRQLEIEKKEEEIKTLLAEQERAEVEAEREENEVKLKEKELEIKEKELALLRSDQELKETEYRNQQLEKARTEQALALAQQQLEAEKRDRQIVMLGKEKELQDQKLKQKALEEEKQKKAIQLLEADKKLKDEQLKYTYWIFALFAIILAVIIFSFLQKRKDNKMLKAQQNVIEEKNNELQQNMEDLQAAQEVLSRQKEQLEVQHTKITFSIKYAQRIQNSILPPENMRNRLFPEHFVTYLPKDIVSGDFYWVAEKNGKRIISVIDCTGHGVPGALMSMIGSNALNELVNQKNITDPAEILGGLHEGIRNKLSQEESKNHDGMDASICTLEHLEGGGIRLVFAGAKQTLFLVKDGKQVEFEGDRKSIGGANSGEERIFTNKEIEISKGDIIYLTSDGFIDQNGPDRVRFNKKRFRELIKETCKRSMEEQKTLFEQAIRDFQQNAEQRDDITLLGVKI